MPTIFKAICPLADTGQIADFEVRHSLSLPNDYRQFLLHHNGGAPRPACVHIPQLRIDVSVDVLFGITSRRGLGLDAWMVEFGDEMPPGFLIIGGDPCGGFFILGTQAEAIGVFYWDHQHFFSGSSEELGNTFFLSDSFTSWIDSFHELEQSR